jgi:hypothetical protein
MDHYKNQTKVRQKVPLGLKDTIDSKKYDFSEGGKPFYSELSPHVMSARGIKSLNETSAVIKNGGVYPNNNYPIDTLMSGTADLTPEKSYLRSTTRQQPYVTMNNYEKAN